MFGFGLGEILVILVVALIVVGPQKLPDLARALARGIAEFRRATDEIQQTVQRELHAPIRDDFLKDLDAARAQVRPGPPPWIEEEKSREFGDHQPVDQPGEPKPTAAAGPAAEPAPKS